jgi:hypothetical protein
VTLESVLAQPVIWSLAVLAIGALGSLAGGALTGLAIGGRQFGLELATQMGGLFGLLVGAPGVAVALILLSLVG